MKKVFSILAVLVFAGCQRNEVGWISIQSTPEGAAVYLDDSLTNEVTDCVLNEVQAGEHLLKLTLDDYYDWGDSVVVEVDDTLKLDIKLTNKTGYIDIQSQPQGAEVFVGINSTEEVTNCILEVPTGEHTVKLLLDDYKEWSKDITVEAEDTVHLNAYLIPDTLQPGDVLWTFDVGFEAKISAPAISPEGVVYFSASNESEGILNAVNPDGTIAWNLSEKTSYPVVSSNGSIYCLDFNDNTILAVNPNGSEIWNYSIDASICESPACGVDGSVYFTSGWGMHMYALTFSGEFKWKFDLKDMRYYYSPTIGIDGTIYFVYNDPYYGGGCLMAMSDDREIIWEYSPWVNIHTKASLQEDGWAIPPSIASDGSLYYSLSWEREYDYWECELHGVNPDGTRQWCDGWGDNRINSVPVIGLAGSLYMGFDNRLYAFESDGKGRWSFGAVVCGSPAIGADGKIYFGSSDGYFYVVNLNGELGWKTYLGGTWFSSPAINDEGIIYIGSDDGYLYAIYSESGGLANTSWPKFKADNQNTGRARF